MYKILPWPVSRVCRSFHLGLSSQGKIRIPEYRHWNHHAQTNKDRPSRSIYWPHRLNRYFRVASLRKRNINRCLYVLFYKDGGEDKVVSHEDRPVQISREFPRALTFSSYNICRLLYIKNNSSASVAGVFLCMVQDLGSNPRSE